MTDNTELGCHVDKARLSELPIQAQADSDLIDCTSH